MDIIDNSFTSTKIDYFFLAGGSDTRAYEVLRKLIKSNIQIENVVLFNFEERISNIDLSDSYYEFKKLNYSIANFVNCSIKSPASCLKQLSDLVRSIPLEGKSAIDISCFTKPFFFYLIKLFKEKYKIATMDIFYTEPQSYIFPKGLFDSFHSSSGPLTVREIPGYPGIELRNEKRILVILLGFDGDLSQEINEDVTPSETLLVNGFPGYAPKFKDISLVINEKFTSNKDIKIYYARANNPFEVYNLLDRIKKEKPNNFLNIAPLGTKPMALGACLFAIHNPEVRVVYPIPDAYERLTTEHCWNSWRYIIPMNLN